MDKLGEGVLQIGKQKFAQDAGKGEIVFFCESDSPKDFVIFVNVRKNEHSRYYHVRSLLTAILPTSSSP